VKIKQSVCLPMIKPGDIPLDEFAKAVKTIGFVGVEMWGWQGQLAEVGAVARRYGLTITTLIAHSAALNDADSHQDAGEEIRRSVDAAAEYGVPGIICFSGQRREDIGREEAIETTAAGLRHVAPYAEDKGVNLNLELLNSKIDHVGYDCDHTDWAVSVCERVNSPRVKVLYDIYHMQIMEGDVIRTITENIRWIGHFHTAGVPGRRDPDNTQELNYAAVCGAIAQTEYNLYVAHEFSPKGDCLEALKRVFEICDRG
jgi:hydroxypyruvate isomerase